MPDRAHSLVLAIDIGSSSVRTAFFTDRAVQVLAPTAVRQYSVRYHADGGAELNPNILLRAARGCLQETLRKRRNSKSLRKLPIAAVAGSAFWHSLLGLERNGRPSTPVFTWADSRSAPDAAALRRQLSERKIQLRTGCMLRAPYWPAKLHWLRRTDAAVCKRTVEWVSPARWIFRELFGADVTSHSMASGTGLYDLQRARWDPELCQLCGVQPKQLGVLRDSANAADGVPEELRAAIIFAALGDGAASNLGSGADRPGRIAINVGTSAAAREMQPRAGEESTQPAFGLFKYVVDDERTVVGGAISNGGNLHQWCLRELRLNGAQAEKALSRGAAANDALIVLPFWVSERSPTWPEESRGTISGFTPVTSAEQIVRAVTVSSYYRLADIVDELQPEKGRGKVVIVSGGILHSAKALALLADVLGRDLRICRELESSLRGAAVHALEKLGRRVAPLRPGRLVRHRLALAAKHRLRRGAQDELEHRLRGSDR